jgi:CO/xanthine dehydrogenase Mo-binding subunit/aerobic-type carbon monoxide dehydrogenase small subunit (CoxS/CutS family)
MEEHVEVSFTLNSREIRDSVPPDKSLLWYIRERRNLTGTKNGCARGHCGVCTVLLNGKPVRSCVIPMKSEKLKGAVVETIESLASPDGKLHPIQQAFVDCGAIQCGFCTPGMIMSAKALLSENADPSTDEIKKHFGRYRNICRCTGYAKIVQAVKDAAWRLRGERSPFEDSPEDMSQRRPDASAKATGAMKYGDDYRLPGMLHGVILWSAHPHAVLKRLDVTEAERMPGVVALITADDVGGTNKIGLVERDQPAIVAVGDRVRYIGDPLAAVFAESEEEARAALEKIKAEYEVLPGVFTIEDSSRPDSPKVHGDKKSNLFHHARIERGNLEEAFGKCRVIIEDDYETSRIEHAFMEPESGVGRPDEDGGVILEIPSQTVFDDRTQLSESLGMPLEKIRIVQIPQGGSFGAKEDMILQVFLALGSLKSGRPVKMVLTREESLRVHQKRHPVKMHYRVGCDQEGNLLALDVSINTDKGAYAALGFDIMENMVAFCGGAYYVPAVRIDGKSWYTNSVMSGAMRGFGSNQVGFALESLLDRAARELGMDPFEIRLKNALRPGLPTVADHVLEPGFPGIRETLIAVRDELSRTEIPAPSAPGRKIGVGIGCGVKNIGFGHGLPESSGAIVDLDVEGRVTVRVTHHEYGQGALAGEASIASMVLGIPQSEISILSCDTALTPHTGPTTASRQTFLTGNAVIGACKNLLLDLKERAARKDGLEEIDIYDLRGDSMVHKFSGKRIPLRDLGDGFTSTYRYIPTPTFPFQPVGEKSLYGTPEFRNRPTHWCYSYGTHAAIVEVDEDTGDVRVLKVIASHDVGRIINRRAVEGQIEGGVVMGVGFALSEQYVVRDGVNITDSLLKCGLVTADRAPEIVVLPVEVAHPEGPFGLKGLAETPSLPTAPAVLNAVYDATGVRINSLPATREKVKSALQAKSESA